MIKSLLNNFDTSYPDGLQCENPIWIGAISFEERCMGSLNYLIDSKKQLSKAILIDYHTKILPGNQGEERRSLLESSMFSSCSRLSRSNVVKRIIEPYIFDDLLKILQHELSYENISISTIILDVTCLTKVHAVAASTFIAENLKNFRWIIAYSLPNNYPSLAEWRTDFGGWKDIIISPLGISGSMQNQHDARGIIFPGHEGHRLVVSMGELEPQNAVIILADTPGRPDFRYITLRKNAQVRKYLRKIGSCKREVTVDIHNASAIENIVKNEIESAKSLNAPLFLYPFGPKSFIIAATITASRLYLDKSWFVYPIPTSYDLGYTEGFNTVLWLPILS